MGWALLPALRGGALFSDTYIPEVPGAILSPYAYNQSANLSDKVASEISAALEAANGGGAGLSGLYSLLDGLHSPVIQLLYSRMSASPSPNQKILGLSGLIRGGSVAALSASLDAAPTLSAYPFEAGVLLSSIRDEFRSTDSTSIEILGQIATASTVPQSATSAGCGPRLSLDPHHSSVTVPGSAARRPRY